MTKDFDTLLKLILIGDAAVGKTAMLLRYTEDVFEEGYICTIGVDFKMKAIVINDRKLKLQIWDTAGQERFKPITNCYFRGSHGCIVVFDVSNRKTFGNIKNWIKEYREFNSVQNPKNVIIIGNKADKKQERQVKKAEAIALARKLECEYIETSAKTGENLGALFEKLSGIVVNNMDHETQTTTATNSGISIDEEKPPRRKFCCSAI